MKRQVISKGFHRTGWFLAAWMLVITPLSGCEQIAEYFKTDEERKAEAARIEEEERFLPPECKLKRQVRRAFHSEKPVECE